MSDNFDHISALIVKSIRGELDVLEENELNEWANRQPANLKLLQRLTDESTRTQDVRQMAMIDVSAAEEKLAAKLFPVETPVVEMKPRRRWYGYAAAIVLFIAAGVYLWTTQKNENRESRIVNSLPVQNDVAPGGNKAVLTLADGSHIILDSAANGKIAQQGTAEIKKEDGKISYSPLSMVDSRLSTGDSRLSTNTLSTPRGGQYQLTLPDGTKVWLNAASSITYPTAFINKERKVSVTGEAYFEVAKDKAKPFIVATKELQVRVLGTHFNVNAYEDEGSEKVTLVEGSVNVAPLSAGAGTAKAGLRETKLKPGQQAILDSRLPASAKASANKSIVDSRFSILASPDLEQVLAWKNGAFSFEKVPLENALREISRWYDVQVIYPNGIPEIMMGGGMGRDLNLSEVLKVLEGLGVKATLEQRKLFISK